jgi:glyoxylase-like metal-dependent hydrolase (beta-lactamase superfamily II)
MEFPEYIFEKITVGPLDVNCYVLGSKKDNTAIVIDAGGDPEKIFDILKKYNLSLRFLLNTHVHFDHVGGVKCLQDKTGAQFLLHQKDTPLLDCLNDQTTAFGLPSIPIPKVDKSITDNEEIRLGDKALQVIHTPGHSPGSVCFFFENAVFVGDTLFAGSIGRTDLYGGSYKELITSIKTRLFTLDDSVTVFPGHGECTTIGDEKRYNPFFNSI